MKSKRVPKYCHHKGTDQAYVTLNGKVRYLGRYNSTQSREAYRELVDDWLLQRDSQRQITMTVGELELLYWEHAQKHYRKNGKPTSEIHCVRSALRYLRKYHTLQVSQFSPLRLKDCRKRMLADDLSRTTINRHVWRIRKMFSWAVENEFCSDSVARTLDRVTGLQAGRTDAREGRPVQPVSMERINAVKPFVTAPIWGAIKTQLYGAMRPGEVLTMRGCDLETTGEIWEYRPESHKTQHHGIRRIIYLGPKAQAVISGFLKDDPEAYLFRPRDVRDVKPDCTRQPGERYNVSSYRNAIKRACELAFKMPSELRHISHKLPLEEQQRLKKLAAEWRAEYCWHPHQLRHTAATLIRRETDLESASLILGHSGLKTTEIYAVRDAAKARDVVARLG